MTYMVWWYQCTCTRKVKENRAAEMYVYIWPCHIVTMKVDE